MKTDYHGTGAFPADDSPRNILIRMPDSMARALETIAQGAQMSRDVIIRHAISSLVVSVYQARAAASIEVSSISDSLAEDIKVLENSNTELNRKLDNALTDLRQALRGHTH